MRTQGTQHSELLALSVSRVRGAEDLPLPAYQTDGAAGLDLRAAEDVSLEPGGRASVRTGICVAIPRGHEGQVRPRSGLALNHGVTVLNAPGTIDADYRGEVRVLLVNLGGDPFFLARGGRVAQLVVCPVARVEVTEVAELPATSRGDGGFGSTGIR